MMDTVIVNAMLITADRQLAKGWVSIQGSKIAGIGFGEVSPQNQQVIDARGLILLPGFIDLHVHGAAGHDTMDAAPQGLEAMAQFYARHGVTSFLAATLTDSFLKIMAALENIRNVAAQEISEGARLLGAYLEGPYLNAERCGAQNPTYVRRASREEAQQFIRQGTIRVVTVAPEFTENQWLIAECVQQGITVSVAHSDATFEQMEQAAQLGITLATHTFNAMSPLGHRQPGIVGAVMLNPAIYCELIADLIHVHPAAIRVLWAMKQPDKLILISDAMRATGMSDGDYTLGDLAVKVSGGTACLSDGTLAGSVLTLDRALHHFMQATGEPLEKVWQVSSLNAAKAIGIAEHKGSIQVGKDADLILVDPEINVYCTLVEGKIVYQHQNL